MTSRFISGVGPTCRTCSTSAIRFPIVEGYVFKTTKGLLKCEVDKIETLSIDPKLEPTTTFLREAAGYDDSWGPRTNQWGIVAQDRATYYSQTHLQTILFQITQQIIDEFQGPSNASLDKKSRVLRLQSRHQLFPQVFSFVQRFVQTRVQFNGVDPRELGLEKYARIVVERLRDASDEPPPEPCQTCGKIACTVLCMIAVGHKMDDAPLDVFRGRVRNLLVLPDNGRNPRSVFR